MYDCIVVGSGIAGLWVALLAQQHGRVLLLTKADLDDSNTNHAQGGVAAAVGADDCPEAHWRDTLVAGAGLSDPAATWVLCREGPERIADLISLGLPFDREHGEPALAQEGAHGMPRVLHAGGDATGRHMQVTLGNLVRQAANVTVREHHLVTELIATGRSVGGVAGLDCRTGQRVRYRGRCVVLASGGAGQLYQHTTNPPGATGTGLALAYRVGASVADLEFCQFHPTALQLPGAPRFLISEAARGEGGILINAGGRRFMTDHDPRGELAPRHIVAEAILGEMERSSEPCVYLDLSHLPVYQVLHRFPTIVAVCRQYGLDPTRERIPVAPAAHYMMGGVRTDLWGETDLPGLFACGEVACTGVHGANRLASNSLLEALVFGSRIVRRIVSGCLETNLEPDAGWPLPARPETGPGGSRAADDALTAPVREDHCFWPPAAEARKGLAVEGSPADASVQAGRPRVEDLQALMWASAGMRRSRHSLEEGERQLGRWATALPVPSTAREYELRDMLLAGRLLVAAALVRRETRGAHRRVDYPREEAVWRRRLVWRAPTTSVRARELGELRVSLAAKAST
ncbi:MAG: L-aspartate oxidase [Chloroflexota bacterium]